MRLADELHDTCGVPDRSWSLLTARAPPAILVVNRIPASGQDVGWLEHELPSARGSSPSTTIRGWRSG